MNRIWNLALWDLGFECWRMASKYSYSWPRAKAEAQPVEMGVKECAIRSMEGKEVCCVSQ